MKKIQKDIFINPSTWTPGYGLSHGFALKIKANGKELRELWFLWKNAILLRILTNPTILQTAIKDSMNLKKDVAIGFQSFKKSAEKARKTAIAI